MRRRIFLKHVLASSAETLLLAACVQTNAQVTSAKATAVRTTSTGSGASIPPLEKPLTEWRKLLPANAYAVLFEEATEQPFTSPLNNEHRTGTFICAACNLSLFSSATKFDSGTGWPSFYDALPNAVGLKKDTQLFMPRTEYHCARCGGHQGHVFDDGPAPTGKRYCNNGLALRFVAEGQPMPALRS